MPPREATISFYFDGSSGHAIDEAHKDFALMAQDPVESFSDVASVEEGHGRDMRQENRKVVNCFFSQD